MHSFMPFPTFQPVTLSEPKPDEDPRSQPLDLKLTPHERDAAALIAVELESQRRERNGDLPEDAPRADFTSPSPDQQQVWADLLRNRR